MSHQSLRSNLGSGAVTGDGSSNGAANGEPDGRDDGAWCSQCDQRVPTDAAGRCSECGSFTKGNPGGAAIRQRRRQSGQQLMDAVREELVEDAGGESSLTGAERLLIEQAVRLEVLGRSLAADVAKKGPGTDGGRQSLHALLATLDRQARALNLLGTDRRPTGDPYRVIEAAIQDANRDADTDDSGSTGNGGAPSTRDPADGPEATAQAPGSADSDASGRAGAPSGPVPLPGVATACPEAGAQDTGRTT